MLALLALLGSAEALYGFSPVSNGCEAAPDCTSCIGGSYGSSCGWCAVNTTTSTAVGAQCADLHSTFDCDIQFQTDKCSQGWVCEKNHTNGNAQCVPAVGGISNKTECESRCASSPPPPTPPSPTPKGKFLCDFNSTSAAQPMCKPCPPNASKTDCSYADTASCSKACVWKYQCDFKTNQCKKGKFGDKDQTSCAAHCVDSYQCDDATQTCKKATPGAPGPHYPTNSSCAASCPAKPQPIPYQMRGIWRGLEIQGGYTTGEWVGNITADTIKLWYPTAKGYALYMNGTAYALAKAPQYVIVVNSTGGKLKGQGIRLLAQDFSQDPEVYSYLQLALDEQSTTQELPDFDTGMIQGGTKVLGLETCPGGLAPPPTAPAPPPPPPLSPPPCKAKLDVVIILDGSASIISSDWQLALQFTNQVVGSFDLGPDKVNIGVTQFSDNAVDVISLSDDANAIEAAVSATRQMERNTNTASGFTASEAMLGRSTRTGLQGQLVILVTDGKANEGGPPSTVTNRMKAAGVQIFGIGVGPSIDQQEIESWVSLPLSEHFFTTTNFAQLDKVLKDIVANACKPKPPPFGEEDEMDLLEGEIPPLTAGKNCKFYLPPNLPLTDSAPVKEMSLATEVEVIAVDPCNTFTTCPTCIGQRKAGKACGWCTGDLSYAGVPSKAKCAGEDSTGADKWTCTGHYQTTSCDQPGSCGLNGVYRGLRIDNGYEFGEWEAEFTPAGSSTSAGKKDQAKFTYLDPKGSPTNMDGTIECAAHCDQSSASHNPNGVAFKLTVGTDIYNGICGYVEQVQAETTGLMWAISNKGIATPPADFDTSMLNTNATVYTYYKCSDYKGATCKFNKF